MTIRGIVFDIGGVLEITPKLGVTAVWEERLRFQPGELDTRLEPVWEGGSLGKISESEVYAAVQEIMGMAGADVKAMMDDMWREYLGTLNVELDDYFRGLRPRFQTAILSNSFVGAREREQAHYQFEDSCDFIIYSHEVGLAKPDQRIYELTCERLNLKAEEVIFVDDANVNIEGALVFGIHGILFKDNAQTIGEIEALIESKGV